MENIHTTHYVSHGAKNASSMKEKSFLQSVWDRYGGNLLSKPSIFLSKMNNPLSVTIVNDDLIRPVPEFMQKSSMQKETSIDIRNINKFIYKTMQPVTTDPFIKLDRSNILSFDRYYINKMHQDENVIIENLTYNIIDSVMCKEKSTMESHSVLNVREIEKSKNISNSWPMEIGLQKCTDTDKDTSDMDKKFASNDVDINIDAKSFFIVSHSDVPELIKPATETPISRLSVMCQIWKSLITRLYDFTINSVNLEISVKRPSYLSKRSCRRRANAIAMGRGRGRARCQLRRSGVSQTRHRKERTKRDLIIVDYEVYENDEIQYYEMQSDPTLNDKSANLDDIDGYDVPDGAMCIRRTSPVILSSSDVTPTKRKPQTPKNQEIMKHPTRSYITDPLTKSNKDCISETFDTEKSSYQLQMSSVDSEDNCMIFKSNNESPKEQAEDCIMNMYHALNWMKSNEDCNSEVYNTHNNSFRWRLLSESSVDSEDSFIIFENESPKNQETMKYPRVRYVVDPLIKVNSNYHKDCNSETSNMQNSMLRSRLLSESSSTDSEDSFIVFETSNDESLKQGAEDPTEIHDIYNFSMKINDYCKDYNSKRYKQEDSLQFSENSEDTEDSFCILFSTELEENCITNNVNYSKPSTSTALNNSTEDELTIENDKDSKESINEIPIKKVSFAPVPTVHVMVTWDYAYRAARKGQWEEMARDNERFKGRINSIAAVLNPILTSKHRSKVWQERFAFQE